MRRALLLPIAMYCTAFALPANALVVVDRPEAKTEKPIITIAARCPAGMKWVPAGYQRKGRWRDGHCSSWVARKARPGDVVANQLNAQEVARNSGGGMGGAPAPAYGGPRNAYGQPNQIYGIPGAGQPSAGTPVPGAR
jgi:hypothetical protein